MTVSYWRPTPMSFAPDSTTLRIVADAVDQVLGSDHAIAQALRMPGLDDQALAAIYRQIDALPAAPRRALAAMVADALTGPDRKLH